ARILPFPSVTFSDVVVEGPDGSTAATVATFSMDAELAPFLSGEVLIFDMRLDRPDAVLNLTPAGGLVWPAPEWGLLDGEKVSLEKVAITDGRLTVRQPEREPLVLSGIDADLSARAL
ncbi:MAG: hypothetical protein KDI41_12505, partial [Pseudomonadales bacterium]|nr:hypothetical protein [Pseudomonadales bacterium]